MNSFMKDSITLQEVIELMDSGAWFSIDFVTIDLKRGTGGEWIHLPRVRKNPRKTPEEKQLEAAMGMITSPRRDPHHYENSTRNLQLANGLVRKVHLRLIRKINGKTVL